MTISLPKSSLGRAAMYFGIQFIQYALMVANGRAYMQGLYMWTALTDGTIATIGFLVVRRMAQESATELHGPSLAGYVLGGVCGSLTAIYVTKILYGQ